jgi:N6-L-threonylcarbamoyladenine synthase
VRFPRALQRAATLDFSFSGLKTAVVNHALGTRRLEGRLNEQAPPQLPERELRDLVASFQEAVVDALVGTTLRAAEAQGLTTVVVSGGVAANTRLREKMSLQGEGAGLRVLFPGPELCTDNAAMIAAAAWHLARKGRFAGLDLRPSAKMKPGPC